MTTPEPEPTPAMLLAAINRLFDRFDGIEQRLDTLERRIDSRFDEVNRANIHTAQLLAAQSGDITGVARQLIDHLNRHHAA